MNALCKVQIEYKSHITHMHITHFNPPSPQLFRIQPPHSNPSSSTLTLLRPVTSLLKFSNHSTVIAVLPLWNKLPPGIGDKYLTHPTNSLKPLPMPSLHNSFTPN